jgi:hypothetical protein
MHITPSAQKGQQKTLCSISGLFGFYEQKSTFASAKLTV